jgi:hypothetical protein
LPMEKTLIYLSLTMQKITKECKQKRVTICDHVTSHMRILALDIRNE